MAFKESLLLFIRIFMESEMSSKAWKKVVAAMIVKKPNILLKRGFTEHSFKLFYLVMDVGRMVLN